MSHHKRPTKANTDSALSTSSTAQPQPVRRHLSFQGRLFQLRPVGEHEGGEWRRPVRQNGMPKLHR